MSIFIIKPGGGDSFSPLCVSLPPLISLLLREQAAGTSWSVVKCVAGQQNRGLSNLRCAWAIKIRLQLVSAWPESLFKRLFRFCSLELLLCFQSVAANIWGVLSCASLSPVPGFKSRQKDPATIDTLQTPTTHFLTCEQKRCCLDKCNSNSQGTSRFSYRMYSLREA